MSDFLTFEEMKLWRSSTEKLTLEEFALKLGKTLSEKKETKDLYDIIKEDKPEKTEKKDTIVKNIPVIKNIVPETTIKTVNEPILKPEIVEPVKKTEETKEEIKIEQPVENIVKKSSLPAKKKVETVETPIIKTSDEATVKKKVETVEASLNKSPNETAKIKVSFKKELAPREKVIFDYLVENKGKKILIKDLAKVLNLPNDYIYRYIKNLREKIIEDVLINADSGGYILNI